MIRAETWHVAICDACDNQADHDGGEYQRTAAKALGIVQEEGWFQAGTLLVCRECIDGAALCYDDDKADADAERMVDRRVVITNGDHQGRVGIVASYDADRGQLFVDLEAVDRPWSEPFTLACGPTEAALT